MVKADFTHRSQQPELMDTEQVSYAEFQDCLLDLETINRGTLAYRPTLSWFKHLLAEEKPIASISIFDIGCGGGDMLRKLWKWAKKRGISLQLTGIDMNPLAKKIAEAHTSKQAPIQFETSDIFTLHPSQQADFIISSLFAHHLTDNELVKFILWMEQHTLRGWLINDLHRHVLPYYFIHFVVRLFRFNRLVQHDASISVARAFTASDWQRLLKEAGIAPERYSICWFFPFRYRVTCVKR